MICSVITRPKACTGKPRGSECHAVFFTLQRHDHIVCFSVRLSVAILVMEFHRNFCTFRSVIIWIGNTRSHGNPHVSAPISCSLPDKYATRAYISTPRLPRRSMFPEPCRAVSTYSGRSASSVDLSHARFCSHLSLVLSLYSTIRQRSTRRLACPRTEQT